LRDDKERRHEALWKKAVKSAKLEEEVEVLKAENRSLEEAATSKEAGILVGPAGQFGRQGMIKLQDYLAQATRELKSEVEKRRT
jgi:hypothetical protein